MNKADLKKEFEERFTLEVAESIDPLNRLPSQKYVASMIGGVEVNLRHFKSEEVWSWFESKLREAVEATRLKKMPSAGIARGNSTDNNLLRTMEVYSYNQAVEEQNKKIKELFGE